MLLKKKYKSTIERMILVLPFCIVMSLFGVATSAGFVDGWFIKWTKSLLVLIPIGYLFALIFIPFSQRIISKIVWR